MHPSESIPCPACGYNLHGLPETACPECGSAFTTHAATRIRADRVAAWEEVLDCIRAAQWLWACVIGSVAALAGAMGISGDSEAAVLTVVAGCLLGMTGLGASWGIKVWTAARMEDPESFGIGPSTNLRGTVRAVSIPAVLIAIPCMLLAIAVWTLRLTEWIW